MSSIEPIHPGEYLAKILDELSITQLRLAQAIGAPSPRIGEIARGDRSVTADTALRLGKAPGMSPEYWSDLQRMYDLDVARATTGVNSVEPLVG